MKHAPIGQDAPLALAGPSARDSATPDAGRHDGWTRERQVTFLRELAATHSVARAAREVGMSRQSAYGLRARLKGEPFDLAWHAAMQCQFDVLAEAALDRAPNGVEVPHFYQGELIHTSRRFDERLTVALLAMRERLGPQRQRPPHRASAYGPEDFGPLLERVERGPETWDEEVRQEYEQLYEEFAGEFAGDDGFDETDDYEESDEGPA